MRLARLKIKKYSTKYEKWISPRSESEIYRPRLHPDKIIELYMRFTDSEIILEIKEKRFILDMTIEEAETEINKALGNDRICPNCAMEKL